MRLEYWASRLTAALILCAIPFIQSCSNSSPQKHALQSKYNFRYVANDNGGRIIDYAIRVKSAEQSGKVIRFAGTCDSACTLYLSLPSKQKCILPGAKFRFHHPYGASKRDVKHAKRYMMRTYPSWVRRWIRRNGGLGKEFKTMNYAYASRYIRPCKSTTMMAQLFRS